MKPEASTNQNAEKNVIHDPAKTEMQIIEIPKSVSVKQLSELLKTTPISIIKVLMKSGIMANINQTISFNAATIVAKELGFEAIEEQETVKKTAPKYHHFAIDDTSVLKPRPPVVTIMGHVDHGKTKLLDAIRKTNVMDTEAGGITQHIGAYQVEVHNQKITFLDTPGHEAFTAMRARGAQLTDIAILVVAADDGVMPQTIEANNHAKSANVPIVDAINKIDKSDANVDRVKQQLAENGVVIEEWGGDVVSVQVSAKGGIGISELLDNLLIVAEILELKANPNRHALGIVIEAELDKTKGPLATVLVQQGSLKVGDTIVVGQTWGKIKAMFNDKGKQIRKAEPSTPVEIMGLNAVPEAGENLQAVVDDHAARDLIQKIKEGKEISLQKAGKTVVLEDLYSQIKEGRLKELKIILKTDVKGSIDPIKTSLERLNVEGIKVRLIHIGTGNISETDVFLAIASGAIIIGFNTKLDSGASHLADSEGVDIRNYSIIYNLIDDIEKALTGMLEPIYVDVVEGHAQVKAVFGVGKREKIAGSLVNDGKITRGATAKLIRTGKILHTSTISSLKHFKDDVREMAAGFECGIGLDGFNDFEVGDVIETYRKEQASRASAR
ncbi:MAG: translation initiation factor IF-2 [Chloroflexi bacterium]|nr:translation initiation factor IF-2 [Chloroflexota bacterium]